MSSSDPNRPARPSRRFSALKPAVKRTTDPASPDAVPEPEAPKAAPPPASSAPPAKKASDEARIAKVMARAGLCSRRDAEAWIAEGRVAVNGATIDSPALNVGPGDAVMVDGYPIDKPEKTRLFLFHKARGLVTTNRDPEGRPTVFDALPEGLPRLMTIGRLDINTEGLLLLTNDGGLARLLELPATGWIRRYRVRANGTIDQAQLDALAKGITIEGVAYAGIAAKLDRIQGANLWLTMGLKEGKNREIKRVLEHLGLAVTRLIRISFGPFQLGELADNAVEEVRTRVLRDQLGTTLVKQAGLDLDGPAEPERPEARSARTPAAPEERPRRPATGRRPADEAVADAPRRQTRRSATADRKGRPVAVERIVSAGPGRARDAEGRQERAPARGERPPARGERAPAQGERPPGRGERSQGRGERPSGPRGERPQGREDRPASREGPQSRGERAPSRQQRDRDPSQAPFRRDDRPSRAGGQQDRAASARPPRRAEGGRGRDGGEERVQRPSGPPRNRKDERGATAPARNGGDERRTWGDRPPVADRPGRSPGPSRRPDRDGQAGRPPRDGGPKPGGKAGGRPDPKDRRPGPKARPGPKDRPGPNRRPPRG